MANISLPKANQDISFFGNLSDAIFRPSLPVLVDRPTWIAADSTATTDATDFLDVHNLLLEVLQAMRRFEENAEPTIPEIFDLRPLVTQHVNLNITAVKPGTFYFLPGDLDGLEKPD